MYLGYTLKMRHSLLIYLEVLQDCVSDGGQTEVSWQSSLSDLLNSSPSS